MSLVRIFALLIAIAACDTQRLFAAPLGSPQAVKGGQLVVGLPSYPKHLLYYLGYEEMSEGLDDLVFDTLIEMDPNTWEPMPRIASSWKESEGGKVFTFQIDPHARFSDGTPVMAEDVAYTFQAIMDPNHQTAPIQGEFSAFDSCTVLGPRTVEFRAKTRHYADLEKFNDFYVLAKHYYSQGDFNKAFGTRMLGSGPYILEQAVTGEKISLKRDSNYWGAQLPQNIGRYNFDRILMKAVPDYDVQFEMFKRGDIDYYYFLLSKMWATETSGPLFQNGYAKKLKVENHLPYGTPGVAWNLRRPLFQDRRVRLALSYLMDRARFIHELFYDNYIPSTGPVPYLSEYHSPANEPVLYNPQKAKALLGQSGWTKTDADGILRKGDARFEFDILAENPAMARALTLYQEDLKRVGIKMNIRVQDFPTVLRLTDDRQFDAALINRARDITPRDFSIMWGSKEADEKGSANLTGYKNPELDRLDTQLSHTFDRAARVRLIRRIDQILGHDQPVSWGWEPTYFRLAYWNRFSFPGPGYFNYSYWRSAYQYWWYDAAKDAKLKQAMAKNEPVGSR